jgi:beta-galactosidase beta subunit
LRYVDDTILCLKNQQSVEELLEKLNNSHPSISFTCEYADEHVFAPFLDTKLRINNRQIEYQLYTKATNRGIFINYSSSLPMSVKMNAVSNEILRTINHSSSTTAKERSLKELNIKMQKNGCSKDFMRKITSSTLQHNTENNEQRRATKWKTYISVPFIDDSFNNKIRRLFREVSNDIQVNYCK